MLDWQPDSSHINKLTIVFDSPPGFGRDHDCSPYDLRNITFLLLKYLGSLPQPVLAVTESLTTLDLDDRAQQLVFVDRIIVLHPIQRFLLLYLLTTLGRFNTASHDLRDIATTFHYAIFQPRPEVYSKEEYITTLMWLIMHHESIFTMCRSRLAGT